MFLQCHVGVAAGAPQAVVRFHGDRLELLVPLEAVGGHQINLLPQHRSIPGLVLNDESIHAEGVPRDWETLENKNMKLMLRFYQTLQRGANGVFVELFKFSLFCLLPQTTE